ncbi:MAG: hypothetical protein LLG04_11640 [Parachlamydia sp.]|nr:hypothetical protein [Parachlamydia sp.]
MEPFSPGPASHEVHQDIQSVDTELNKNPQLQQFSSKIRDIIDKTRDVVGQLKEKSSTS